MQFDKDMNSQYAQLFLDIRDIITTQLGINTKEKFSENITSYFGEFGGVCYLRTTHKGVHIGWFRGVYIVDTYGLLFGNGKTIRGQTITKLDSKTKKSIAYYVTQTQNFLIEHKEMMKIRKMKK